MPRGTAIVFTTYSKLTHDVASADSVLRSTLWHRIVLDESQTIKNGCLPVTKSNKRSTYHAIMQLWANHRW